MKKRQKQIPNFPPGYSLSKALLDILYDLGEHAPFGSPSKNLWRSFKGLPKASWWRYNRAMKYLESFGQIELINKNDELFIKLTKKGKLKILLAQLDRDFKKLPKWDGRWRLILWDVPESSNHERDKIRRFFKDLGCYQLQKSVFITPHPLPVSAVEYLKESGLLQFIRFVRADKLDDSAFLKRHFKL